MLFVRAIQYLKYLIKIIWRSIIYERTYFQSVC